MIDLSTMTDAELATALEATPSGRIKNLYAAEIAKRRRVCVETVAEEVATRLGYAKAKVVADGDRVKISKVAEKSPVEALRDAVAARKAALK